MVIKHFIKSKIIEIINIDKYINNISIKIFVYKFSIIKILYEVIKR